jgi:hypothetical protein
VSTQRPDLSLFEGLQRSGMTPAELWIRYYAVPALGKARGQPDRPTGPA